MHGSSRHTGLIRWLTELGKGLLPYPLKRIQMRAERHWKEMLRCMPASPVASLTTADVHNYLEPKGTQALKQLMEELLKMHMWA